ncbi:diacylglycerol kinase [Streptomonospora wellingtoniae]|uniref:Diacylglycerol kinase n=1 Tax=Streptomonospora wellingtoniae TaxID=3075544 RepID=A0ABU2KUW2_9ACTN|nr:diacylglycerol kinase [Streptomonospora sp. DSM 45055]MDT0303048.1 diacylglycerol kinase [Streptomonospora sp. DSM 45055]
MTSGAAGAASGTVTLLVNPAAGGNAGERIAARAARRLLSRGVEVDVVAGRDAAETRERARACVSAGADVLAVAGGDGMVHLALQELARTSTALAVLPSGTGNDFARALGIPSADPDAAADVVLGGVRRRIDLGRCSPPAGGGRPLWFGTVLTSGFDSLVVERTDRMRWPRGRLRYAAAVMAELGRLRPLPFTIEADGHEEHLEGMLVAVGNTAFYGGGMRICPHADPGDGRLAVTAVGPATAGQLLRAFPRIYRGTHATHPLVRTFHANSVRLHTPGMRAYADGEPAGPLPLHAEAVAGAVEVLVPR